MKYLYTQTESAAQGLVTAFRTAGKRAYYLTLNANCFEIRVW